MRIDPDGYKLFAVFIVIALIFCGGFAVTRWQALLWIFILFCLLAVYTLFFFRDPERAGPEDKDAAVSAADGVVVDVSRIGTEGLEGNNILRIAVFMNVFNVHVNRTPLAGTVSGTKHRPGKKLSAFNRRAEYENEYGDTDIVTRFGNIRIRQIAGLIARRVVTRVKEGEKLNRGDRLGLIRFGSRVDVFLPAVFEAAVKRGDHVRAGETLIARSVPHSEAEI